MMYKVIIVFCALLVLAKGQTTNVNRCLLSPVDLPLNAYVHGCNNPPCLLPQLEDVVIDVIFQAPRTTSNMTTLATAILNFIIEVNIPYDLGVHARTCNFFTNTYCPILEGEVVQYRLRMFIESFFPVGTVATVEFRIVDNDRNNEVIWCIRLPIQILPPRSGRAGSDRAIADANKEGPEQPTPILVVN